MLAVASQLAVCVLCIAALMVGLLLMVSDSAVNVTAKAMHGCVHTCRDSPEARPGGMDARVPDQRL